MKRTLALVFCFVIIVSCITLHTHAAEASYDKTLIEAKGFDYPKYLSDNSEVSYADNEGLSPSLITVSNSDGIHHLYVIFDKIYGEWTLTDTETQKAVTVGRNGFLHEYINIAELFGRSPSKIELKFENNAYISEIYAFSEGDIPSWVQQWNPPLEKADILLLSSHSDDEQLFFAGILPYYAAERKADVQVVYLISHFDTHTRPHEQLNGLWTVGIRNYPVISEFPDLYSESLDSAISAFEAQGYTYDDFTDYIVSNIRRFKPQVLVTHDVEGEYGHGTHIYCTDVVMNSLSKTSDPEYLPESADKYGVWDVPKTYLHLYEDNQIVMNWDIPLDSFNGKTAFEMTVEGFACHKSQHWTWFNDWIHGKAGSPVTKATEIKTYSPCIYGLYRTTVGNDTLGGDFLENIVLYKDQTPPETDPPKTEEVITKAPSETAQNLQVESNYQDTQTKLNNPMLLISILVAIVIAIIVVYIVFSSKSIRKPKRK